MPDIFVSYNRDDRETARLIASALEAEGLSVWWDAALRAGEAYDEVTEHNLRTAGAVVVLWSKRSASSKWVRAEATVGERSSTLVPVLIEDCERPIRFELVQTADLRHWRGDRNDPHWRDFMQDIKTAISKRASKPSAQAAPAHQTQAAASAPPPDASIETAFWNSVKDGADRSDFEAYLARYPNGHFASLARNRLAALARPAQPSAPVRPAPAPAAPAPAQRSAVQQATAPRPAPKPQQRPAAAPAAPAKKSGGGLVIGGIVVALVALGAVGFVVMRQGGGAVDAPSAAAPVEEAAEASPVAVATTDAETAPGADFEDVFAPDDANDQPSDEIAAIDVEGAPPGLSEDGTEEPPAEEAADVLDQAPAPASTAPASTASASTPAVTATAKKVSSAKTFRDCDSCPEMARIPGGEFVMGSPDAEPGRNAYEGPQLKVKVPAFAIGVYEVTVAEWNACAADGACPKKAGDANMPALGVSWREAASYAEWLSKKTGRDYRLPSEAEWEYAARAGTVGAYWWGDRFDKSRISTGAPAAVGAADENPFGLHDVIGNAREWVADCYVNNFTKLPTDGSASTDGDCGKRVIRGGAWSSAAVDLRVANRSRIDAGVRVGYMGVRVAAAPKK